jgi:hypothetical protein
VMRTAAFPLDPKSFVWWKSHVNTSRQKRTKPTDIRLNYTEIRILQSTSCFVQPIKSQRSFGLGLYILFLTIEVERVYAGAYFVEIFTYFSHLDYSLHNFSRYGSFLEKNVRL